MQLGKGLVRKGSLFLTPGSVKQLLLLPTAQSGLLFLNPAHKVK